MDIKGTKPIKRMTNFMLYGNRYGALPSWIAWPLALAFFIFAVWVVVGGGS